MAPGSCCLNTTGARSGYEQEAAPLCWDFPLVPTSRPPTEQASCHHSFAAPSPSDLLKSAYYVEIPFTTSLLDLLQPQLPWYFSSISWARQTILYSDSSLDWSKISLVRTSAMDPSSFSGVTQRIYGRICSTTIPIPRKVNLHWFTSK